MNPKIIPMIVLLLAAGASRSLSASDGAPESAHPQTAAFARRMADVPDGGPLGESQAWQFNHSLKPILEQCERDPEGWLPAVERILNALADKMTPGPDGYKGFVGPYIYNKENYWCDVHVGDAILVTHMLRFAQIVKRDPRFIERFGGSAARFLGIGRKDLVEKWIGRGTMVTDGPFAGFREWNMFCRPGDMTAWFTEDRPRGKPSASLPFNKALDVAYCMLQLYDLTGEPEYRNMAEKICNRVKAGMNPIDGGYTWNYWEPLSPKDVAVDPQKRTCTPTHWINTHPNRNYQSGEVDKIVYAYDWGVTFTEADIRRLVVTNLRFMWNGDAENPAWENSNSRLPGYEKPAPSKTYPTTAGTLWTTLARFDPTLARLHAASAGKRNAAPDPAGYARKYAPDAVVEEPAWMKGVGESRGQMLAAVIPSVVAEGGTAVVLSKAYAEESPLEIYVRPLSGGPQTLLVTQSLGKSRELCYVWDGTIAGRRTPGEYVIVWRYRGGERAYPVTLR